MTQPSPIIGAGELNTWLYGGADASHLRSIEDPETMSDPSVAETTRVQGNSLGENLIDLGSNAVQQLISLLPSRLEFVAGAVSPLTTAVQLSVAQFEASAEGKVLKRAYRAQNPGSQQ